MNPPSTPFHLLYDGERYHVVAEGGRLPEKLVDAWASGALLPNAIRTYRWYGGKLKPGWYVGLANGNGIAYRRVRCMARAKAWLRQRYLNPPPEPEKITRTITAIDRETRTVTLEG